MGSATSSVAVETARATRFSSALAVQWRSSSRIIVGEGEGSKSYQGLEQVSEALMAEIENA